MTFEQAIQILSQEHGAHQGTWTVPAVSPTLVESIMCEGQEGKVFHRFGKTLIEPKNVISLAERAQREHEAKIQEIADLVFD